MKKIRIQLLVFTIFTVGCAAKSSENQQENNEPEAGAGDTDTATEDTNTDSDDGDGGSGSDVEPDTDTETNECTPGEIWCSNNKVSECGDNGLDWIEIEDCADKGLLCAAGECTDISKECASAMNGRSYIGCEYWGTTLSNGFINLDFWGEFEVNGTFKYAVAVGNGGDEVANLNVTDGPGGSFNADYNVPAGEMILIKNIPWKKKIVAPWYYGETRDFFFSRKVANAAYRLTSDRPVTMYQFNPLKYQQVMEFSYSNDASLLLPAHNYRKEYIILTRPTMQILADDGLGLSPGFFAVVGQAGGPTTVEITYSSHTMASDEKSNEVFESQQPGDVQRVTIEPYEVFQVLSGDSELDCPNRKECAGGSCCDMSVEYDLTGTIIEVLDGPEPAVFAGSNCAYVPFDTWACDHLEQQVFPTSALGRRYLCAHPITQHPDEPTVWRIMSASDNNKIVFTPSSVHEEVNLGKGEYVEFESKLDFEVLGTGRVAVVQFMVGQQYADVDPPPSWGDPSMAYGVPVGQYREDYTFLAPETYVRSYITVVHKNGILPLLDDAVIAGDTREITDAYSATNLQIFPGIHNMSSEEPFGVMVYGVGSYTSYMYPGGLDLKELDVPVI